MAFINANQTRLIYGNTALAAYLRTVTPSASVDMLDVTTLVDTSKQYQAGLDDFTLAVDGLFDSATGAGSVWSALTAPINAGSTVPTSIATAGFAAGNSVWLIPAKTISYEFPANVTDVVPFNMSLGAGSAAQIGVSLVDLAAVTATGNGTTVDNSAGTTGGMIAHLHVTDASGTSPTLAAVVQHSTNGSTWTTLGSFTTATAATSELITATGTVNRYVRVAFTVGGTTPSFTCQVSLARL